MRYLLLVYVNEEALCADERQRDYAESLLLAQHLAAAGQVVAFTLLHPTAIATSVRIRNGKRFISDGPCAESHQQVGAAYLIDAADLDQAIATAACIPAAHWATIEIRPVLEFGDGLLPNDTGEIQ